MAVPVFSFAYAFGLCQSGPLGRLFFHNLYIVYEQAVLALSLALQVFAPSSSSYKEKLRVGSHTREVHGESSCRLTY